MNAEIDNTRRGHMKLSALLWKVGWEADDPEALEAQLQDFREYHWVWEK